MCVIPPVLKVRKANSVRKPVIPSQLPSESFHMGSAEACCESFEGDDRHIISG